MASSASEEFVASREAGVHLDDRTIERIARRVAEILRSEPSTPAEKWLTAADVAARYSVSRTWVYDNAELLGVVRLGTGTKARLRFDPARLREHFNDDDQRTGAPQKRRQSQRRWVPEADLIPIRGH